ncbi:hypothetical protein Kisp01_41380 [Kineosporia sp. NBRC 101677]|nr:hypothetical protein Kisp01_41380 [Kineosporia sp. NBRC 101677]
MRPLRVGHGPGQPERAVETLDQGLPVKPHLILQVLTESPSRGPEPQLTTVHPEADAGALETLHKVVKLHGDGCPFTSRTTPRDVSPAGSSTRPGVAPGASD